MESRPYIASGIYAITRNGSAECYIGSAVNITERWRIHRRDLRNGKHHSRHMQRVHDKHGSGVLEYAILEHVDDRSQLIEREQIWLDRLHPAYNTAKVAGSCLGVKHTDASRAAMSAGQRKRQPATTETRAKMSAALKGRKRAPHTSASHAKQSAAMTGRAVSAATKARISATMTGKKFTPEHCAAIAASALKRPPLTDEARANLCAGSQRRYANARAKKDAA
ncbi:MAG: GIY-YIG nuclease family protein [Telluria sp.]